MSTLSLQNWKVWWLTQSFNIANSRDQRVCSKLQRIGNRDVFFLFQDPSLLCSFEKQTTSQCILRGVQRTLSLKILCQFLAARFKREKNKTPKYNVDVRCHRHCWEGGFGILILEHWYFVNLLVWFSNSARVWPFPRWVGRQEGASSCFKLQNQTSASF